MKPLRKVLLFAFKFVAFCVIFYLLNSALAFVLRNDVNSYARLMFVELHQQKNIDVMICGASHVSHGLYPELADSILNKNTFCAGTPQQSIDGTYAIIREAAEQCPVKDVYLEMDFAPARPDVFKERKGLKSTYLVSNYLKNKRVKFDYLLHASGAGLYLNSLMPLGKEKFISVNPVDVAKILKSKINGDYYKATYSLAEDYVGKGCVMKSKFIPNGSYCSEVEKPIPVSEITDDYKNTVKKIASYCKEKELNLIFFSMPCSDYYLAEKGNYEEYYEWVKNFTASMGYDYFDFNLCREDFFLLEDCDFEDDNHLSKTGIEKFTKAFCEFFYGGHAKSECFHESYEQKIQNQDDRLYGLMLDEIEDSGEGYIKTKIIPIINHGDFTTVAYEISAELEDGSIVQIQSRSANDTFSYPKNSSGKIKINAWFNGKCLNRVEKYFNSL